MREELLDGSAAPSYVVHGDRATVRGGTRAVGGDQRNAAPTQPGKAAGVGGHRDDDHVEADRWLASMSKYDCSRSGSSPLWHKVSE